MSGYVATDYWVAGYAEGDMDLLPSLIYVVTSAQPTFRVASDSGRYTVAPDVPRSS